MKEPLEVVIARIRALDPSLLKTVDEAAAKAIAALNGGETHLQAMGPLHQELSAATLRVLIQAAKDARVLADVVSEKK